MSATGPNWRVAVKKGDILTHQRDLRHDARPRGTRSWGSWSRDHERRRGRGGPVHRPRRPDRLPHPRAPAGEHRPGGARRRNPGYNDRGAPASGPFKAQGHDQNFAYQPGRPDAAGREGPAAVGGPGQAADVRQPGLADDGALPHGHRVQGALRPGGRHRLPAGQRPRGCSTPASSASARRSTPDDSRRQGEPITPSTAVIDMPAPKSRLRQGRPERPDHGDRDRLHRHGRRGRRPRTCDPARTRTSAASTRSCAARSGSCPRRTRRPRTREGPRRRAPGPFGSYLVVSGLRRA